jgi:hypothetical protein
MRRGGQLLDFGLAINQVVERLARHGSIDPQPIANTDHFRNPPATEVGQSEVTHLAHSDEVAHGAHAFLQRKVGYRTVEVQDVDVVGPQPLQAGIHRLPDPLAGLTLFVRPLRKRESEFGGDHPLIAARRDRAPDDLL